MKNWGNLSPEEVKGFESHFRALLDAIEEMEQARVLVDYTIDLVKRLDWEAGHRLEEIADEYFKTIDNNQLMDMDGVDDRRDGSGKDEL